jgi:hypothetical protein
MNPRLLLLENLELELLENHLRPLQAQGSELIPYAHPQAINLQQQRVVLHTPGPGAG